MSEIELVAVYFDREPSTALTAQDIRDTKFDREPWSGKIFDEIKLQLALQVLRSIRDEQSGANSVVKALCDAAIAVIRPET